MKPVHDGGSSPPKTRPLPGHYGPAELCALAWVRSNFPPESGGNIMETFRVGRTVYVIGANQTEVASFTYGSLRDAIHAYEELPKPAAVMTCSGPFELAANVDFNELQRAMNFGRDVEQERPAQIYKFVPR